MRGPRQTLYYDSTKGKWNRKRNREREEKRERERDRVRDRE